MVDHFVVAAQYRVFIFEDVEAMRTSSNDLFNIIAVQNLDILVCHHLEHKFIAGSSCRITCAHFFFTQDGIFNTYFIENGHKSFGDFLCTLVKTTGAAHPE